MRKMMCVAAALVLAGCASPKDLLDSPPTLRGDTGKPPKEYALCVLPQWQEHNAGSTLNETPDGYRIISAVPSIGQTNEVLEIKKTVSGSLVQLYQRLPGMTWGRGLITSSVTDCL